MPPYLQRRLRSFLHAFRGLTVLVLTQSNARLHLLATVVVVIAGCRFHVSAGEWLWLGLALTLVWIAEAFNSALEHLADRVTRECDPMIRDVKDLAASAVLIAATFAIGVAVYVFGSRLCQS